MISEMQKNCYPEGVVLELDGLPSSKVKCLESKITIEGSGGITIVAKNKNEESLKETRVMQFKRYPHWRCHCPDRIKVAFIKGTVHRYVANTSPNAYDKLYNTFTYFIEELRCCEYPWRFIHRVFSQVDMNWLPIHTYMVITNL